jgi:hypothetical protein
VIRCGSDQSKALNSKRLKSCTRARNYLLKNICSLSNQMRGFLAEHGIIIAKGLTQLRRALPVILEQAGLSAPFRVPDRFAENPRMSGPFLSLAAIRDDEFEPHRSGSCSMAKFTGAVRTSSIVARPNFQKSVHPNRGSIWSRNTEN